MKKLFTLLTLIATMATFAQAPQGFNYQAIVRNSAGALITNQIVGFKFSIKQTSASGTTIYSEAQTITPDDLGQVSLVVGTGTPNIGTFASINWASGTYYLAIELNTGAGFVTMGTTQLLSVPYALYANSAGSSLPNGNSIGDVLSWNGIKWVASTITLPVQLPTLTTGAATAITTTTASSGGTISSDGGASITAKGICWSTTTSPTTALATKTTDGSGLGSFTSVITGLTLGTTYYVRAYATNITGTGYGDQITFRTLPIVPTLTTTAAKAITSTTASSGGTISSDGGATITATGVCWSTTTTPTIVLATKTTDGTGVGSFTSAITGLIPGTTYYVRAYATNSAGTGYGDQITFSALSIVPTLTTGAATAITTTTASSGGTISSDGGASITAKGICWSTTTAPTVALATKINNGTGTAPFASSISDLTPGTTYYVRAYGTNSAGTGYGDQKTFSALAVLPTLTTAATTLITSTTASSGGTISSDGGASIIATGVCWSTSTGPTIALATKTTDGTGVGSFTRAITGLTPVTTYYVRAYATNSAGTSYGVEFSFTTLVIPTITNGTQFWQNTNLNVSTYSDGTVIPQVYNAEQLSTFSVGAWCYYENFSSIGATYGKLYNLAAIQGIHDAASRIDKTQRKKLAPEGYHIPSDTEWITLITHLGGEAVAGGKMKESGTVHWNDPNTGATNSSGFTGLPGGDVYSVRGGAYNSYITTYIFSGISSYGSWWT